MLHNWFTNIHTLPPNLRKHTAESVEAKESHLIRRNQRN